MNIIPKQTSPPPIYAPMCYCGSATRNSNCVSISCTEYMHICIYVCTFQSYELYFVIYQRDKIVITITAARWNLLQWRLVVLPELPPNRILKWYLLYYKYINI
jgi:hypothetical protein